MKMVSQNRGPEKKNDLKTRNRKLILLSKSGKDLCILEPGPEIFSYSIYKIDNSFPVRVLISQFFSGPLF